MRSQFLKWLVACLVVMAVLPGMAAAQYGELPPWLGTPPQGGEIPQGTGVLPGPNGGALNVPPPPLPGAGLPQDITILPADPIPNSGVPTETIIAEEEVVMQPVSAWYYPWQWIPLDGWENSAEVGLNGTAGNSESSSFQAGGKFKRKTDVTLNEFKITHQRTQANDVETQNNALAYYDFERFFGESPWSLFYKMGLEYDEFKAFDLRLNMNAGIGYKFIKTKPLTFGTRFGAGTSREFGGPDDSWVPEAVFGLDYNHQINKRNKVSATVDYFPEFTNFNNYRVVSDLSWEYLLDDAGNLSFKLAVNDRYDSTPNGRKPNDVNYSFLLLYKF